MNEVVSYPLDLAQWDAGSQEQPFYLELYGETSPLIALDFAQILPAGPIDYSPQPQTEGPLPIYEYSWTIGHSVGSHLGDLGKKLQDPAASIFLFLPISRGWRVKELVATVKYLRPVTEQEKWLEKLSQYSKEVSPLISDVSELARLVPGAAPFSEAASIVSTIAKLQINNVPRVEGFEWSVSKVTDKSAYGLMQGIQWTIPKQMFEKLGNRLTGSVAVSFIPSLIQQKYQVWDKGQELPFQQGTLLARAEIYGPVKDQPMYMVPHQQDQPINFIELQIAPYKKEAHSS